MDKTLRRVTDIEEQQAETYRYWQSQSILNGEAPLDCSACVAIETHNTARHIEQANPASLGLARNGSLAETGLCQEDAGRCNSRPSER